MLIGSCLILGILSVFASALTVPVVLSFVIANGYRLSQAGDDTCGCFGDLIPLSYSASIAVDAAMIVIAVALLLLRDRLAFLSVEKAVSMRTAQAGGRRRFLAGTGARFVSVALVVLAIGVPTYSNVSGSVNSQIDNGLCHRI